MRWPTKVAQLVEQSTGYRKIKGSNPGVARTRFDNAEKVIFVER